VLAETLGADCLDVAGLSAAGPAPAAGLSDTALADSVRAYREVA
jgi:hypothetical protein